MTSSHHQSQVAKQAAQAAIDRKLAVLRGWLSDGIPYRYDASGYALLDAQDRKLLEFFPTSLRQFKQWDGTQNSPELRAKLPSLSVTGNDTLAKRPASTEQAARLIAGLRVRAKSQLDAGRASTMHRLEQDLRLARQTIDLRIAEIREQQRQLREARRDHSRLQAKHQGDTEEFKRVFDRMSTALQEERQRNSELTALMAKVTPIRKKADGL